MSAVSEAHREAPLGEQPLDLTAFALEVRSPSTPPAESWRPVLVRLGAGEWDRFAALCRAHQLSLLDRIDRQLADLAVVRLPAGIEADRQRWAEDQVTERGDRAAFGTWVYLPWDAKVVHVLDRDDYFEVITNRNRDKLTREEQRFLRTRRVGVIGLSVGGEAAITVAQEHLCGSIVLADFDRLDLSNLNRLNAGLDELGLLKTTVAARRIARIDPYLEVTVFEDGVDEANADRFLDSLDLLIEECDGLRMKFDVRRRVRERGIDTVYAADERGFLSIEPYGSWPELRPFHGRITEPPPPRNAFPTPLAFMRALAEWLGGWENLSERSRSSVEQIGSVLCGYPQLASEARYAAGQIGHVARRLLLGERIPPFVGYLDLAELLPHAAESDPVGQPNAARGG